MRILAVDDDQSILELLSEFLTAFGYTDVETAVSGKDALDIIAVQEQPFDCLLVDIQMPEMNGISLCGRVRTMEDYQNVPIIMLTAMLQKKYIDEAFTAGATDYVTKPFDFTELKERLADAQRLAHERQAAIAAMTGFEETRSDVTEHPGFKLSEPLRIDGLIGFVGYSEFENYVLQMSRARLFSSSVVGVKINDIDRIFAATSPAIFRRMIMISAKVISECIQGTGNLVSYRGSGVFLVIHDGKNRPDGATFKAQLDHGFLTIQPADMSDLSVKYHVGEDVQLRSITKSAAIFSLNVAVESVENKNQSGKELVVFPRKALRANTQSPEERNLGQPAYQVLLKDVLLEEQRRSTVANCNRAWRDRDHDGPGTNTEPEKP